MADTTVLSGYAYNDLNGDGAFTSGEGISGLKITQGAAGGRTSSTGNYNVGVSTAGTTIIYSEGGLPGAVTVIIAPQAVTEKLTIDIVNGNKLVTNTSLGVNGPILEIVGTGAKGLTLTGNELDQTITGTAFGDTLSGLAGSDLLLGLAGNDTVDGGAGIDVAVFTGLRSQYSITKSGDNLIVSGSNDGTDTIRNVELLRFNDSDYIFDQATGQTTKFTMSQEVAPSYTFPTPPNYATAGLNIQGNIYNDTNGNSAIDSGEGIAGAKILYSVTGTKSGSTGAYRLGGIGQTLTFELSGGGLTAPVNVQTGASLLNLDVINGDTLRTDGSIIVSGPVAKIEGTGSTSLILVGDESSQSITGSTGDDILDGKAGSDVLTGGQGNDKLIGGDGIDTAVLKGLSSQFTFAQSGAGTTVTGNGQGLDTCWGIEIFRFDNGEYYYDKASGSLIPFGPNAGPPITPPTPNTAPTGAATQAVTTTSGTSVQITVLATDADGDTLAFKASSPAHGTLIGNTGSYVYTPSGTFTGSDAFTVQVSDGNGGNFMQTVTINVTVPNAAPTFAITQQTLTTEYRTALTVTAQATDSDGDSLTYTPSQPQHGSVALGNAGTYIYSPNQNYSGTDSFTINAKDGKGGEATQTITIVVQEPNLAPVVLPSQQAKTVKDQAVSIIIEASDREDDDLDFTVGTVTGGAVTVGDGGLLEFTPAAGFLGSAKFTVSVDDDHGNVSTVPVTVSVMDEDASTGIPAYDFDLTAPNNFRGSIGGSGKIFGTPGVQHIVLKDLGDIISFDPSFNKGGDILEFAHDASGYIVYMKGSSAVIADGDSQYTIPMGPTPIYLVFRDGVRVLSYDEQAEEAMIGDQVLDAGAALLNEPPALVTLPNTANANSTANANLQHDSQVTLMGKYSVFGTNEAQDITFLGGTMTLDTSFNKGGDTIHFTKSANEYSAYIIGSNIVLLSGDDRVTIPFGELGITLDFAGDERILHFDSETLEIKIGDTIIDPSDGTNPQPIIGGLPLDIGSPATPAAIELAEGQAYTLLEDANVASFVTINGFDADDKIVLLNGTLDDFAFGYNGSDLSISRNENGVLNQIVIADIDANGFVFDGASAIDALGWNFIVLG